MQMAQARPSIALVESLLRQADGHSRSASEAVAALDTLLEDLGGLGSGEAAIAQPTTPLASQRRARGVAVTPAKQWREAAPMRWAISGETLEESQTHSTMTEFKKKAAADKSDKSAVVETKEALGGQGREDLEDMDYTD